MTLHHPRATLRHKTRPQFTDGADPQKEASVAVLIVAGLGLVGSTLAGESLGRAGAAAAAIVQVDVRRRFGLLWTGNMLQHSREAGRPAGCRRGEGGGGRRAAGSAATSQSVSGGGGAWRWSFTSSPGQVRMAHHQSTSYSTQIDSTRTTSDHREDTRYVGVV